MGQHIGIRLLVCCLLATLTSTSPLSNLEPRSESSTNPYAPVYNQQCPGTLVRSAASGIGPDEAGYVGARKKNADAALTKWLEAANNQLKLSGIAGFGGSGPLPTVGLASSGGGWRALLAGGGFLSGLDSRETNGVVSGMSGLYQAMTYHSALSGGSWLLSSIMGNGWQTVSWLKTNLWESGFNHDLLLPYGTKDVGLKSAKALKTIHSQIEAKKNAEVANGQNGTSLTDLWGRLLSYELFPTTDDSALTHTLSGLVDNTPGSPWASNKIPYPIITSIGVNFPETCLPDAVATQYEFSPYEFGSWDTGVSAFFPTKNLGTSMDNGKPTTGCTVNFDNLGYVLGTSSSLFNEVCSVYDTTTTKILKDVLGLWKTVNGGNLETRENYATYPNPFHGMGKSSSLVTADPELYLADGGETGQNDPLWPLLRRKDISVIISSDNSADTKDNWSTGTAIWHTYQRAKALGLSRMPTVPEVAKDSQTAVRDPQFFGCHDPTNVMIISVPNNQWLDKSIIQANQPTMKQDYQPQETDNMLANAALTASQGKDNKDWPVCVACAVMKNSQKFTGTLKDKCQKCFTQYCFNPPGTQPITL